MSNISVLKINFMRLLFLLVFAVKIINISGQTYNRVLIGSLKEVNEGKIYVMPALSDSFFYNSNYFYDSSEIKNGKFKFEISFNDTQVYPYFFFIESESKTGRTGFVFWENKRYQNVYIDVINEYSYPVVEESDVQNEIREKYRIFFYNLITKGQEFDSLIDSLNGNGNKNLNEEQLYFIDSIRDQLVNFGDSLIYKYLTNFPNSEVGLWKLCERYERFGAKQIYQSSLNKSKKSENSVMLWQKLDSIFKSKYTLFEGKRFPVIDLKKWNNEVTSFDPDEQENDIILVDLWFSACKPCIAQFPEYKRIYKRYRKFGFEIIGISVDDSENQKKWHSLVQMNNLLWPNFLDRNKQFSSLYGINSFPSNFLIDGRGIIIKTNISPHALKKYLQEVYSSKIYFMSDEYEPK